MIYIDTKRKSHIKSITVNFYCDTGDILHIQLTMPFRNDRMNIFCMETKDHLLKLICACTWHIPKATLASSSAGTCPIPGRRIPGRCIMSGSAATKAS